ncbi:hypothetical protein EON81_02280 [bacterium]|nr:MAG: hypothetical protein EON81_02280 [bacterium]
MRALALAFAIALTPAAFAQSEPAWRTWLRQGEQTVRTESAKLGRVAQIEAQKLRKRAETEMSRVDLLQTLSGLQEMWRIRGALMIDPEIICAACGMDPIMVGWVKRLLGE